MKLRWQGWRDFVLGLALVWAVVSVIWWVTP